MSNKDTTEYIIGKMSDRRKQSVENCERQLQDAVVAQAKRLTREELSIITSSVLQSTLQSVNSNVRVVPKYPTQEMLDHGYAMDGIDVDKLERAYRAMVEVGQEYANKPVSEHK